MSKINYNEVVRREEKDGLLFEYNINDNIIHYKEDRYYKLPPIHSFERVKVQEYQPVQVKIKINQSCINTSNNDENDNIIHSIYEFWKEYDENGNEIHYKNSNGVEYIVQYDENGNIIHFKDSDGFEYWKEYDENGNVIENHK